MPRTNDNRELLKQLDLVEKFTQFAGGDQTATAAVSAGVTLVTVGATTSFASLDPVFLIGDGGFELNEIVAAPATAMPLRYKTLFAHSVGARLVEAQKITLGDIEQAGVGIQSSQAINSIMAANAFAPIANFVGPTELSFTIPLYGWNNLNMAAFFGITEAETGAGTAADPHQLGVGEDNINSQGYLAYRLWGTLLDGRRVMIDLLNARNNANGGFTVNRQNPGIITLAGRFNNMAQRIYTP